MSFPIKALDRVFQRMSATYGVAFLRQFGEIPIADIKSAWCDALEPFGTERGLLAVAWALDPGNLPDRPPNAVEFRRLCKQAPAPVEELPVLPAKADPERVKAELSRLGGIRAETKAKNAVDHKAWAHRLKAREEAGETLGYAQRTFWRQALESEAGMHGEGGQ